MVGCSRHRRKGKRPKWRQERGRVYNEHRRYNRLKDRVTGEGNRVRMVQIGERDEVRGWVMVVAQRGNFVFKE